MVLFFIYIKSIIVCTLIILIEYLNEETLLYIYAYNFITKRILLGSGNYYYFVKKISYNFYVEFYMGYSVTLSSISNNRQFLIGLFFDF